MRHELLARSLALLAVVAPLAAQGDFLYSVSSTDGLLRRVNPLTGAVISSVQMVTNNNVNAQGCTGLSCDPATGQLYAIMREVSQPAVRKLARVNPANGSATILGVLNDNFAALAFRADGVLFAVTGDGAAVPETSTRSIRPTRNRPSAWRSATAAQASRSRSAPTAFSTTCRVAARPTSTPCSSGSTRRPIS